VRYSSCNKENDKEKKWQRKKEMTLKEMTMNVTLYKYENKRAF
jgi:hypothetical protein